MFAGKAAILPDDAEYSDREHSIHQTRDMTCVRPDLSSTLRLDFVVLPDRLTRTRIMAPLFLPLINAREKLGTSSCPPVEVFLQLDRAGKKIANAWSPFSKPLTNVEWRTSEVKQRMPSSTQFRLGLHHPLVYCTRRKSALRLSEQK